MQFIPFLHTDLTVTNGNLQFNNNQVHSRKRKSQATTSSKPKPPVSPLATPPQDLTPMASMPPEPSLHHSLSDQPSGDFPSHTQSPLSCDRKPRGNTAINDDDANCKRECDSGEQGKESKRRKINNEATSVTADATATVSSSTSSALVVLSDEYDRNKKANANKKRKRGVNEQSVDSELGVSDEEASPAPSVLDTASSAGARYDEQPQDFLEPVEYGYVTYTLRNSGEVCDGDAQHDQNMYVVASHTSMHLISHIYSEYFIVFHNT